MTLRAVPDHVWLVVAEDLCSDAPAPCSHDEPHRWKVVLETRHEELVDDAVVQFDEIGAPYFILYTGDVRA